jgi:hypothetical protein
LPLNGLGLYSEWAAPRVPTHGDTREHPPQDPAGVRLNERAERASPESWAQRDRVEAARLALAIRPVPLLA